MYKKAWRTCKLVVLLNKPIGVLTFLLPSPSSLLKLPKQQSVDFCPFFSWMTFRQNSPHKLFHGLYVASYFWKNPPTMPATAEWHTIVPRGYQRDFSLTITWTPPILQPPGCPGVLLLGKVNYNVHFIIVLLHSSRSNCRIPGPLVMALNSCSCSAVVHKYLSLRWTTKSKPYSTNN